MSLRSHKSKLNTNSTEEASHWIFFTKESIWKMKNDKKIALIKLRHPKTGHSAMFLSDGEKELQEILCFKPKYSSWFLDNSVVEDGSIYVSTPVDPLFLILPYLKKYTSEKFMTFDQTIVDEDFPECYRLIACCSIDQLKLLTDIKGNDDIKVCRLNKTKTLEWLQLKVDGVVEQLKRKNVQVTGGAQVATYIRSNKDSINQESYRSYAHGLISDYLDEELSQELYNHLGLEKIEKRNDGIKMPPPKKPKLDKKAEPLEDYFKSSTGNQKNDKIIKLNNAQKQLQKVDKSGMKSISSFFTKK